MVNPLLLGLRQLILKVLGQICAANFSLRFLISVTVKDREPLEKHTRETHRTGVPRFFNKNVHGRVFTCSITIFLT